MVQEGNPIAYESRKLNDRDKEELGTREGDCLRVGARFFPWIGRKRELGKDHSIGLFSQALWWVECSDNDFF